MRELLISCTQDQAEAWSDRLLEAGALAVTLEDAAADTEGEQAIFGEPGEPQEQLWHHSRLVALLADGQDPQQLLALLDGFVPTQADAWQLREVPDADWVRLTQAQFGPIQVDERIWIVPSWHRDDADLPRSTSATAGGPIRIELDPGLAFGTGSHPTTHLCLQWLAHNMPSGASVLDYGCGSGILALAAAKLGAHSVIGVDIDAQAVQATLDNARANQVSLRACLPDDLAAGSFDLVIANILSNPLKVLAPLLAARVATQGWLVLAGVLERQATEVAQAYAPWLELKVWAARSGWVCLVGHKP